MIQQYTSEELRQKILTPLSRVIADMSIYLQRMHELAKENRLPDGKLPLNAKSAIDSVGVLALFSKSIDRTLDGASYDLLKRLEKKRIATRIRRAGKSGDDDAKKKNG